MVHQGEGLTLGLEASHHVVGVHAQLDELEGDGAADRRDLLGLVHDAHAAFAEDANQAVRTDRGRSVRHPGVTGRGRASGGRRRGCA